MTQQQKPKPIRFAKYDQHGPYHWLETDRYSRRYNPPLEARYELVLRRVAGAKKLLDVGCGDGYLMGRASAVCGEVVGVESEPTAVALAAKMLASRINCTVLRGSCYELPFRNLTFDAAVLADVIEHLETPDLSLSEVRRVLSPDGVLVISTPKWRPDRKWDPRHVKEYRSEEFAECLRSHFSEIQLSYFWPSFWSDMYATRLGWRVVRQFARYVCNPFLREGTRPDGYGQILALCRP